MRFKHALSMDSIATPATATAAGIGVVLGPYIDFLYGEGRHGIIYALYFFIFLDWLTAMAAAHKHKTYSSEYGINGILRTLFILMFPSGANILDHAMGTPGFLFHGLTFGLIYHTFKSATANGYRAGWERWIPQQLIDFVGSEIEAKANRAMQKKGEKKDDTTNHSA